MPEEEGDEALPETTAEPQANEPITASAANGSEPHLSEEASELFEHDEWTQASRTDKFGGASVDEPMDPESEHFAAEHEEEPAATLDETSRGEVTRQHLKGLLESLVFVSDKPIKASELAKAASAQAKEVQDLLLELKAEYAHRGILLDEVAGGWVFRTNAAFSPFVRDLTKQKPVKMSRAQLETLAILAYRQPITRPEIDEIRGVDSGATLKMLLERDLVRILGKKDEPGRPLLYGTTPQFLEFFGLKSLKDMPTLKEFTELNEDSLRVVERELGDVVDPHDPSASARVTESIASTFAAADALSDASAQMGQIATDRAPPLDEEDDEAFAQTQNFERGDDVNTLDESSTEASAEAPSAEDLGGEDEDSDDDDEDSEDEDFEDDDDEDDDDAPVSS